LRRGSRPEVCACLIALTQALSASLQLDMYAYSEDDRWTTVAIVTRIVEVLNIWSGIHSIEARDGKVVIGFHDLLRLVMERAVPQIKALST
jgi:hypothetical protein